MAATVAETRANSREIEKLRERTHEYGNHLQSQAAILEAIDKKIDGYHESMKGRLSEFKAEVKEDLTEIKTQTTKTNGRVGQHDRQISRLQGGLAVVLIGLPTVSGCILFALEHL